VKLGSTRSDDVIEIIAPHAFATGRYVMQHVRRGRVEFERREVKPGPPFPEKASFHWVIIAIERPDEE
jgi:hypothetical protein